MDNLEWSISPEQGSSINVIASSEVGLICFLSASGSCDSVHFLNYSKACKFELSGRLCSDV